MNENPPIQTNDSQVPDRLQNAVERLRLVLIEFRDDPGTVDRLLTMMEIDQAAIIEADKERLDRDDHIRLYALLAGSLSLLSILAVTAYVALNNHDWVAAAIVGSMGVGGIIGTLVNAYSPARRSPDESASETKTIEKQ